MSCDTESIAAEGLGQLYDAADNLYEKIETSTLDTNSDEFQEEIQKCICRYEQLTLLVTRVDLFSINETIDELPTSSIKYLILPARLGSLTLRRQYNKSTNINGSDITQSSNGTSKLNSNSTTLDRLTVLKMSKVYIDDFLTRCKQYEITTYELPKDESSGAAAATNSAMTIRGGRPTPQQLKAMGQEREAKVRRYREKKELEGKIKTMRSRVVEADEETQRDFYNSLVMLAVTESIEALEGIRLEQCMLLRGPPTAAEPLPPARPPMRTFLITRDAAQKQVYGAGYPSLPIMSVDEFYEKRVQEGWWPPASSMGAQKSSLSVSVVEEHDAATAAATPDEERQQYEDTGHGDDDRERLEARDDYRDTHRTGWGNTYNRS